MKAKSPARPARLWQLRLYVAGQTTRSTAACKNLRSICDRYLKGRYQIRVIDLLKNRTSPRATRSWRFPPWSAACPNRCEP